ncbi:hypothetical protein Acr_00g0011550 [Actinidia rufa]|uniref:Uncharacterized protein n=1 Tax=Actinidia rufa TaxID=165716 RepID=A0A7J0DB60_9ERIC|nr:hypothetical protein Acr_00g0011550 [Actinidia rufa]
MVMQQVQSLQRVAIILDRMKQQSAEMKKTNKKAQNEVATTRARRVKALHDLDELQAVAYGPVNERRGIPENNPAWAKTASAAELPESPKPYSPLILPCFNEEEYMNEPSKEDGEEAQANEATKPMREVVTEEVGEAAAEVGNTAIQDPLNYL